MAYVFSNRHTMALELNSVPTTPPPHQVDTGHAINLFVMSCESRLFTDFLITLRPFLKVGRCFFAWRNWCFSPTHFEKKAS